MSAVADSSTMMPNAPARLDKSIDVFRGSLIELTDDDLEPAATWLSFTTDGGYRTDVLKDVLSIVPDYLRPSVSAVNFDIQPKRNGVVVRLRFDRPMSLERATILTSAVADAVGRRFVDDVGYVATFNCSLIQSFS